MDEAEALAAIEGSTPDPDAAQSEGAEAPTVHSTESFTDKVDPSKLTGESKALYESMLGDYTRKTQEVAPWRKEFEDLDVNPSDVRAAYEFYQNLNSDPDFAKSIYSQLGDALQQFTDTPETGSGPDEDIDPVQAKLTELESRLKQMDDMAKFNAGAAELQRSEMALRSQHEDWNDEDFGDVYHIATSFDGNLLQAGNHYESMENRIIAKYLKSKGGTSPALASFTTGANAAEAVSDPSTTKEAHVRALEYLNQQFASEG